MQVRRYDSSARGTPAGTQVRNAGIDYLRLIAACGIVVFHLDGPGAAIGYAGLPLFAALMAFFAASRMRSPEGREGLARQARNLLVLWIGWSAVYGAMKLVDAAASHAPIISEFEVWMLLTGPAIHLWFLPFAALFLGGLRFAGPWLVARTSQDFTLHAVLSGLFALAAYRLSMVEDLPTPLPQWLYVMPALIFGLLLGQVGDDRRRRLIWALVAGTTTGICYLAINPGGAFTLMVALVALTGGLSLHLPPTRLSASCRQLSMAVYILHPLIVATLMRLSDLPREGTAMLAMVIGASLMASLLILRSPLRGWMA